MSDWDDGFLDDWCDAAACDLGPTHPSPTHSHAANRVAQPHQAPPDNPDVAAHSSELFGNDGWDFDDENQAKLPASTVATPPKDPDVAADSSELLGNDGWDFENENEAKLPANTVSTPSKHSDVTADSSEMFGNEGWDVDHENEAKLPASTVSTPSKNPDVTADSSEMFGNDEWGFDNENVAKLPASTVATPANNPDVAAGSSELFGNDEWGFDHEHEATLPARTASTPPKNPDVAADSSELLVNDGWDFDNENEATPPKNPEVAADSSELLGNDEWDFDNENEAKLPASTVSSPPKNPDAAADSSELFGNDGWDCDNENEAKLPASTVSTPPKNPRVAEDSRELFGNDEWEFDNENEAKVATPPNHPDVVADSSDLFGNDEWEFDNENEAKSAAFPTDSVSRPPKNPDVVADSSDLFGNDEWEFDNENEAKSAALPSDCVSTLPKNPDVAQDSKEFFENDEWDFDNQNEAKSAVLPADSALEDWNRPVAALQEQSDTPHSRATADGWEDDWDDSDFMQSPVAASSPDSSSRQRKQPHVLSPSPAESHPGVHSPTTATQSSQPSPEAGSAWGWNSLSAVASSVTNTAAFVGDQLAPVDFGHEQEDGASSTSAVEHMESKSHVESTVQNQQQSQPSKGAFWMSISSVFEDVKASASQSAGEIFQVSSSYASEVIESVQIQQPLRIPRPEERSETSHVTQAASLSPSLSDSVRSPAESVSNSAGLARQDSSISDDRNTPSIRDHSGNFGDSVSVQHCDAANSVSVHSLPNASETRDLPQSRSLSWQSVSSNEEQRASSFSDSKLSPRSNQPENQVSDAREGEDWFEDAFSDDDSCAQLPLQSPGQSSRASSHRNEDTSRDDIADVVCYGPGDVPDISGAEPASSFAAIFEANAGQSSMDTLFEVSKDCFVIVMRALPRLDSSRRPQAQQIIDGIRLSLSDINVVVMEESQEQDCVANDSILSAVDEGSLRHQKVIESRSLEWEAHLRKLGYQDEDIDMVCASLHTICTRSMALLCCFAVGCVCSAANQWHTRVMNAVKAVEEGCSPEQWQQEAEKEAERLRALLHVFAARLRRLCVFGRTTVASIVGEKHSSGQLDMLETDLDLEASEALAKLEDALEMALPVLQALALGRADLGCTMRPLLHRPQ